MTTPPPGTVPADPDPSAPAAPAPRTLVTGATGDIGSTTTRLLADAGATFRVLCRRPDQVADHRARGIDAVQGDLSDPTSLAAALSGCDQLFLVPPVTPDLAQLSRRAVDVALEQGVRHVVKISAADGAPDSPVPWAHAHHHADVHLRGSGVGWTTLRAACFMTNLLPLAPVVRRGLLLGSSGDGTTPWIATTDVAAASVRVLTDPATWGGPHGEGRDHLLTGTEPTSFPQVAEILSRELGRRVRYVQLPGPALRVGMRAAGSSSWEARGLVHQFADVVRHGRDGVRDTSDDLVRLLGRPATDLAAWIREHRSTFA